MSSKTRSFLLQTFLLCFALHSLPIWIPAAASQPFNYHPELTLEPSSPMVFESVSMNVSFFFGTDPPHVEEFGPLTHDGNTFSVNVTIFVPAPEEQVLFIIHTDSYIYDLGNLSAGDYEFNVYVHHIHYTEGMSYLAAFELFTVFFPSWNIGDVNQDLKVDIYDIVLGAGVYGTISSDPGWNPQCDIASPWNVIDIFDLVTIASHYGEEYTP